MIKLKSNFNLQIGITLLILIFHPVPVLAVLNIEISGAGEHQIPVSIVPFAGEEKLPQSISSIVSADLVRSGLFKLVDPRDKSPHDIKDVNYANWTGIDALSIGKAELLPNGRIIVKFHLLDPLKQSDLLWKSVSGKKNDLRTIGHMIANVIYQKLTGSTGVFNTQIAYVNRQKENYKLVVADSDGYNEKVVYSSNSLIMSPAWSPDGSYLAYAAFENDHNVVYIQSMLTNQRFAVANFSESNSAPAWSPNGRQLAFAITKDGSSHIYLIRPDGTELQQITFGDGIDTEPFFSPDGASLIYASDFSGKVQIYQISVDGGDPERLTFAGGSSFSPHFSSDGNSFVFSNWINGKFFISVEDTQSKRMQVLTEGGWNENPSFAPNGKSILFASEVKGHGVLSTISIDGKVKQTLFSQAGSIMYPAWGPLTKP